MEIIGTERSTQRSPRRRRWASVLAAAAVAASALVATQPATADAPWLTQLDGGYIRFTIPVASVEAAVGPVSQVVVEGNFAPSANWGQIGLSRSGANWSATFGPLDPGSYYYQVTGDDSKVMKDPTNPTSVASEPEWSTFFVAGDSAALLADAPQEAGNVTTLTYHSDVADEDRSALVWTPPGYNRNGKPYPVLYLQHGGGQGYRDWTEVGRAEQILDNLSLSGELADMVVVMGDGNVPDFTTELLDNLIPAVRDAYYVSNAKKDRALAGLSMGGVQAFRVLRDHPGEFAYVGVFGAGPSRFGDIADVPVEEINDLTTLFRLYVGNKTDIAYNDAFDSMEQFDALGLEYQFDGVNPDNGHNWNAWQENLIDFAPRLFHGRKQTGDPGFSDGHTALVERFEPPAAGSTPTPWITDDGFVTFETTTDFADAEYVSVWSNWGPGGSWVRVEASKVGDRWRATVGPLDPWSYYYRLIVDRVSVKDASNPTKVTSEPTWSTFFIPGEESRLLADVPAGDGGDLDVVTYQSTVAGQQRSAYVWTPPGYDPDRAEPYPLFVLNHGGGQSWTDWVEVGRARQILDNLALDGATEPMVVVMPNGNVSNFNAEILDNVLPAVEAGYHISSDPARRAMAGLSAGGARTAGMVKAYPGAFSQIGLFSAGFGSTSGIDVAAINAGTDLLRMYVGDITDFVYPSAMSSMAQMEAAGIEFEFDGITIGPHGWDPWQKNLIDFAPRLFHDAS
ncbi:alpha/beta hydrolase-fold protein [Agromyces aurantiacus]|uniref:Alpha/beta hydrolase-fold protein n=1 Tax=Agromyces aurantiacus TaxID=165814 RepID=A0ABV9R6D6_9MICO|nr:alpha/beta hydrolase-fold protein [Agromyces aurantiacus]MBM7503968.1 enterochelin esterase-like enzyme [Agromyces aurantiacus]